jgi:hypothetical protein
MMINLTMPSYLVRTQRPSDKDHTIQGASIPQNIERKKNPGVHSFSKILYHPPLRKNLKSIQKKPTSIQKKNLPCVQVAESQVHKSRYLLPMSGWMAAATADMK